MITLHPYSMRKRGNVTWEMKKNGFFCGGLEENMYFCVQIVRRMTEVGRKYRLNSMEEPTDEMLRELMEDVAKAARESSAKAEAEKQRRLQTVASEIGAWRKSTNV